MPEKEFAENHVRVGETNKKKIQETTENEKEKLKISSTITITGEKTYKTKILGLHWLSLLPRYQVPKKIYFGNPTQKFCFACLAFEGILIPIIVELFVSSK